MSLILYGAPLSPFVRKADAVLHGAAGDPKITYPDGTEAGLDFGLKLRFTLDIYANVRYVKWYEGVPARLTNKNPKDIDYIVRNGKIESVDEFTGRIVDKRRWPDGLQSTLEAKEGLSVQEEGIRLGSITLQHFMRLYPKLCGMTGTAVPAADEFKQFYNLETIVIPTNRPCIRLDAPDVVFTHREAKEKALIKGRTNILSIPN